MTTRIEMLLLACSVIYAFMLALTCSTTAYCLVSGEWWFAIYFVLLSIALVCANWILSEILLDILSEHVDDPPPGGREPLPGVSRKRDAPFHFSFMTYCV